MEPSERPLFLRFEYPYQEEYPSQFDQCYDQLQYGKKFEESSLRDDNSVATRSTPGLVTVTTDSRSSSSHSPPVEPADGQQPVPTYTLDQSRQGDLIFPTVDEEDPPRKQHLELPENPTQSSIDRANSNGRRQRKLVDPEKASIMRGLGACIACKFSKTGCSLLAGDCDKCRKNLDEHGISTCFRKTLSATGRAFNDIRDVWTYDAVEEILLREPRKYIADKIVRPRIVFSPTNPGPVLHSMTQAYQPPPDTKLPHSPPYQRYAFTQDSTPSREELKNWVQNQITCETLKDGSNFTNAIARLVMTYSKSGDHLPRRHLVSRVHEYNCMYRIWKQQTFYYLPDNNSVSQLPVPIQALLRHLAKKAMESLEIDILKEIDTFLDQKKTVQNAERLAVWLSLWQMILIYRELLGRSSDLLRSDPDKGKKCVDATKDLLKALALFYHGIFHSKKNIESVNLSCLEGNRSEPQEDNLRSLFAEVSNQRMAFYKSIQQARDEIDHFLKILIVDNEIKKLLTRPRRKRPPVAAADSAGDRMDIDEEDIDAEHEDE